MRVIYMHTTLQYFDLKGVQIFPEANDLIEQKETYTIINKNAKQ